MRKHEFVQSESKKRQLTHPNGNLKNVHCKYKFGEKSTDMEIVGYPI